MLGTASFWEGVDVQGAEPHVAYVQQVLQAQAVNKVAVHEATEHGSYRADLKHEDLIVSYKRKFGRRMLKSHMPRRSPPK